MSLQKAFDLAEHEGYLTPGDMLRKMELHDSVIPGICTNDGCSYVVGVEPDQGEGWCHECKTNTVKSFLVLMGLI